MYELYPYFTNDSSVGLFSRQDDDIYHSTYGALSESWQKFIIPSGFKKYVETHKSVKILDICYGIGYNTKTSLNVFIKNFFKKNKNSQKKIAKKMKHTQTNIAAIGTDNILEKWTVNSQEKNLHAFSQLVPINIAEIDTDNISNQFEDDFMEGNNNYYSSKQENNVCNNILIDAVDLDKTLIYLSPFMAGPSWFNYLFRKNYGVSALDENKYQQIKNLKKFRRFIRQEFRLKKEVSIILFKKLLESNSDFFEDAILQTILNLRKYSPFLSRFMRNFAKFYLNQRSDYNKKPKKLTFLHNIYYRYVTRSYKNAENILKNCKINVNIHKNDARDFVKSNNTTYNFIFLDAFTPAKCPVLWTVQFFSELYKRLEDDGMILTYSNSAAIRNALWQSGFCVGKIYDEKLNKFVGTVATKNQCLIDYPLDGCDMGLLNSKAGIPFRDENFNLDNDTILENRRREVKESTLLSSSQVLKQR